MGDNIQLMPFVAGLFAIPELVDGLKRRRKTVDSADQFGQTISGVYPRRISKWDALRGGL